MLLTPDSSVPLDRTRSPSERGATYCEKLLQRVTPMLLVVHQERMRPRPSATLGE